MNQLKLEQLNLEREKLELTLKLDELEENKGSDLYSTLN